MTTEPTHDDPPLERVAGLWRKGPNLRLIQTDDDIKQMRVDVTLAIWNGAKLPNGGWVHVGRIIPTDDPGIDALDRAVNDLDGIPVSDYPTLDRATTCG